MSWGEVAKSLYTLLNGDTGTGGLRNSASGAFVNSVSQGLSVKNATLPIVTFTGISGTPDNVFDPANKVMDYGFQVDVITLANVGATVHEPIVARVKSLLDRQTLSVTGWVNGAMFLDSEQPLQLEGDFYRTILQFSVFINDPS